MSSPLRVLLALGLVAAATLSWTVDVSGSWKGGVVVDYSRARLPADPGKRVRFIDRLKKNNSQIVVLVLDAKRTYTATVTETVKKTAPLTDKGTWRQQENRIYLTPKSQLQKGKPQSQIFILSPNGRELTSSQPAIMGLVIKFVLKRQG